MTGPTTGTKPTAPPATSEPSGPILIESISERERQARRRRAPLAMGRTLLHWLVRLAPAIVLLALLAFVLAQVV